MPINDVELKKRFTAVLQDIENTKQELYLKATGANIHAFMNERVRLIMAKMKYGNKCTRLHLATLEAHIQTAKILIHRAGL
ncbi:MAG: hypothetical protein WC322_06440 [Candidatus Paceibacterota bacterium]|jgi:hypothetical protein